MLSNILNELKVNRSGSLKNIPFLYSQKLNEVLGGISQGKYYAVGGRESSGKKTFTDLHFLIGPIIWWLSQPEPRPKLKILYFNMEKSLKVKMQKWISLYMWLYFTRLIDIPTLNGAPGKIYDINEQVEKEIESSKNFFNPLIYEHEILQIYDGPLNPTGIYNEVIEYMKEVGGIYRESTYNTTFQYDEGYEKQITLVVIDNANYLKNESRGGSYYDVDSLHKKLNDYLVELKNMYKITPVIIVPSFQVPGIYKPSQMTPDYREFKHYFQKANAVIHTTNPSKLGWDKFESYEVKSFIGPDSVPRFRYATIMRNTEGKDNVIIPLWTLPENGMYYDLPKPEQPGMTDIVNYIQTFKTQQILAVNPVTT